MAYVIFNPAYFNATDLDILQMLSHGFTYRQIVTELQHPEYKTENDVIMAIENMRQLLSCRNEVHLVCFAIRKHIIW